MDRSRARGGRAIRASVEAPEGVGLARDADPRREHAQRFLHLWPVEQLERIRERAPAVVVVLVIEDRLPARRRLSGERGDRHGVRAWCVQRSELLVDVVALLEVEVHDGGVELRFFGQLADRGRRERLTVLDLAGYDVPVPVVRPARDEELRSTMDDDRDLAVLPHQALTFL